MNDIILLITVIAYVAGGYFIAGKIGDFIDENYKGYEYDIESDNKINKTED